MLLINGFELKEVDINICTGGGCDISVIALENKKTNLVYIFSSTVDGSGLTTLPITICNSIIEELKSDTYYATEMPYFEFFTSAEHGYLYSDEEKNNIKYVNYDEEFNDDLFYNEDYTYKFLMDKVTELIVKTY